MKPDPSLLKHLEETGADANLLQRLIETGSSERLPAPRQPLRPGAPFGDSYQILGELGRGAMGVVYRALDVAAQREVALKVLKGAADPKRVKRLQREGTVNAALRHPGIVRVHAAGTFEGRSYLAFELVPGARPLNEVFLSLERRQRVEALRDVARALGAAHALGVVHRDVKPENVLVDGDGRIRVADFGLATALDAESLTQTGALLGTPLYMAPEQVACKSDQIGPHTDVWALGVMLYEAIADVPPFQNLTSLVDLITRIAASNFEPPSAVVEDVPKDLEAICLKALEAAPEDRYANGAKMADDLEAWLAGAAVSASRPGGSRDRGALKRQGPLLLAVLASVIVVLLAVIAVALAAREPEEVKPPDVAPPEVPETVTPPPPAEDPAWIEKGARSWRRAKQGSDPYEREDAASAWLTKYPKHPLTSTVETFLEASRQRTPRSVLGLSTKSKVGTPLCVADGALIAYADAVVYRFSLPDLQPEGSWPTPDFVGGIYTLVPIGDGFLAAGIGDLIWRVPSVRPTLRELDFNTPAVRLAGTVPKNSEMFSLTLLPGGEQALFYVRSQVYAVDLVAEKALRTYDHNEIVRAMAVSPDGTVLVTSTPDAADRWGGAVHVWDLKSGAQSTFTPQTLATVSVLAILPDNTTIVAGLNDGAIRFYRLDGRPSGDPLGGTSAQPLRGAAHPGRVRGILPVEAEGWLITTSEAPLTRPGTVCVWSLSDRSLLRRSPLGNLALNAAVLYLPGPQLIAVPTRNGVIEFWAAR